MKISRNSWGWLNTLSVPAGFVLLITVVLGLQNPSAAEEESANPSLDCRYLYAIEQGFLNQHISGMERNKELQKRVINQYIEQLDPGKQYLMQSDVDKISSLMGDVFKKTQERDCSVFAKVQDIYKQRVEDRYAFAKKELGDKYKFDSKVELEFDAKKRGYPKNLKEAQEFQRKYIHFQISNYLANEIKLNEAKENVLKTYERNVRRVKDVKQDDLFASYLDSFARALDPHSSFFSKDSLEDFQIQMSLSLEGIGATLKFEDGFTIVEQLIPGGAAARSEEMLPQDKIIAVGQGEEGTLENVIEMDLRDVVRKIRGKKGSKVRLTILRQEGDSRKRFNVVLTRDQIKLEDEAAQITYVDREVNGKKMKFGVLNLPSFYADSRDGGRSSASDMKKLLVEAKKKKIDGLVLDMASNGGGSLEDAVKIAGLFFKTGNVVKQSSRDMTRGAVSLKDVDPTVDYAGPLVVLTSRISASASEIVAGALKDYDRAVVVGGDHTFGKGSVQSVVPIPQKLGALKVTVGMFYTPGGDSTQHKGVDADISLPGPYSTDEVGEKTLEYSLPPKSLDAFVSKEARVFDGEGKWEPIQDSWLETLVARSQERVKASDEFKKIVEDMKKAEKRGRKISLTEVMKEKEENKEETAKQKALRSASKEDKQKEYLDRPDVKESLNVLADLVNVQQNRLVIGAKTDKEPAKTN